jgi:16S rRNA (guanine966-N2)-methyltransferase
LCRAAFKNKNTGGVIIIRVIAGIAKGHKLKAPKGYSTRPTSDKVKGAIFNIIAEHIPDAHVLDLFSGTGSLGIEALSRGAKFAVFVDRDFECSNIIKENLKHTKLINKSEVIKGDAWHSISKLSKKHRKFDVIFLDPPYKKNIIDETLKIILKNDIINHKGIIVVEHDADANVLTEIRNMKLVRNQKYGDTAVSFYMYSSIIEI